MKLLVDKYKHVIVDITEQAERIGSVIDVGYCHYGMGEQLDIFDVAEIPAEVKPQQYKYINNTFIINDDYIVSINQNDVQNLKNQNAQILLALVTGGLI